jgi:hypothetical protein
LVVSVILVSNQRKKEIPAHDMPFPAKGTHVPNPGGAAVGERYAPEMMKIVSD